MSSQVSGGDTILTLLSGAVSGHGGNERVAPEWARGALGGWRREQGGQEVGRCLPRVQAGSWEWKTGRPLVVPAFEIHSQAKAQ